MNTVLSPDQLTTVSAVLDPESTPPRASPVRRLALRVGVWLILRGAHASTPRHDEHRRLLHQERQRALAERAEAERESAHSRHFTATRIL